MKVPGRLWRLARKSAPLSFPPWELVGGNRFDSPLKEFRTLYCASFRTTCLRECLQDFRHCSKILAEYRRVGGTPPHPVVPIKWRESRILVPARLLVQGSLVELEAYGERQALEKALAGLLHKHGLPYLDLSEVRCRKREVTQGIAQYCFNQGAAGLAFRSQLDGQRCFALFEGRAWLAPAGSEISLAHPKPRQLSQVCREFGLVLG